MKINFVYRSGNAFPWSMGKGFENALKELGHEVNTYIASRSSQAQIPNYNSFFEFLKKPCDLLLVMGGGDKYYPFCYDTSIRDYVMNMKVPRITYMMESMKTRTITRLKYEKSIPIWTHILTVDETEIEEINSLGKAKVDYAAGWIDEEVFKPLNVSIRYDFQFIGYLHKHRLPYAEFFSERLGMVFNKYESVADYVRGINETKMLFAFPSIFTGFTQRLSETMACGKLIFHPTLPSHFIKSKQLFEDRKHLVFYKSMEEGVELAKYYLNNEKERKEIGNNARQEILNKHTVGIRAKQFIDYATK